jgi:hypothetical protein
MPLTALWSACSTIGALRPVLESSQPSHWPSPCSLAHLNHPPV